MTAPPPPEGPSSQQHGQGGIPLILPYPLVATSPPGGAAQARSAAPRGKQALGPWCSSCLGRRGECCKVPGSARRI